MSPRDIGESHFAFAFFLEPMNGDCWQLLNETKNPIRGLPVWWLWRKATRSWQNAWTEPVVDWRTVKPLVLACFSGIARLGDNLLWCLAGRAPLIGAWAKNSSVPCLSWGIGSVVDARDLLRCMSGSWSPIPSTVLQNCGCQCLQPAACRVDPGLLQLRPMRSLAIPVEYPLL